jgi:hypothetical protein
MIAGAKIDAGAWLGQFEIYTDGPARIEHEADGCDWSTDVMAGGSDMLEVWNTIQRHMFDAHIDVADTVTTLPNPAFDGLISSLDEPPVPNEPAREAFRRLDETVTRREDTEDGAE